MNVVIICRKFSGIDRHEWRPSGTPAMVKLIEGLEKRGWNTKAFFLEKEREEDGVTRTVETDFSIFKNVRFFFVPYKGLDAGPQVLSTIWNIIRQFAGVWRMMSGERVDLYYLDRGNLPYAALLATLGKTVVWRCLGVAPFIEARNSKKRPFRKIYFYHFNKILLHMPIKQIICTEDGSPWYLFFNSDRVSRKTTLLLNGVDKPLVEKNRSEVIRERYDISPDTPIILFVGRLNDRKGAREFVRAMDLLRKRNSRFLAIVVGYGELEKTLRDDVFKRGLQQNVFLTGRVPAKDLGQYLAGSNIYVSLSKIGSLTNATLEALSAGKCVLVLEEDPVSHWDERTEALIPRDVVIRVSRDSMEKDLAEKLSGLLKDPRLIEQYARRVKEFGKDFLWSWTERISFELEELQRVIDSR